MDTAQYEIKVYKIFYEDTPDTFYIGSTKKPKLSQRMSIHRRDARKGKNSLIYRTMREKGINEFKYVLIASCMISNIDEQRAFEQSYIEKLKPTLNMNKAYCSNEERKDYMKEYNQKPERKQKKREHNQSIIRTCVCGGTYIDQESHRQTHFNTKKHTDWVKNFYERVF